MQFNPTPQRVAMALMVGAATISGPDRRPSEREVLARAAAYVERLAGELPRLVATEVTVQTAEARRGQAPPPVSSRQFVAEFAWAPLTPIEVLGFRDVVEVDGEPVTGERDRLAGLLHGPSRGSWADVRALLAESARYNLAPGSRNFNLPTVVLFFLHPDMQDRFSWNRRGAADLPIWEIEFEEKDRPTVIRSLRGPAYSRGRVRVEAATGTVLQTELSLDIDEVDYWMLVRFSMVPRLGLTLPAALEERYESPEQIVTGRSEYANYRRFETRARLLK